MQIVQGRRSVKRISIHTGVKILGKPVDTLKELNTPDSLVAYINKYKIDKSAVSYIENLDKRENIRIFRENVWGCPGKTS